jgi:hypothetical protein
VVYLFFLTNKADTHLDREQGSAFRHAAHVGQQPER